MSAATVFPESAYSGRPVLGAVRLAREALSDCSPTRLWALSEPEVTDTSRRVRRLGLVCHPAWGRAVR